MRKHSGLSVCGVFASQKLELQYGTFTFIAFKISKSMDALPDFVSVMFVCVIASTPRFHNKEQH